MTWEDNEPILDYEGALRIWGNICVPKVGDLITLMLENQKCTMSWVNIIGGVVWRRA